MSLILEALKKSERERELGKPPGLTTPIDALSRTDIHRGRVRQIAFLLVGAAILAGAAFHFHYSARTGSDALRADSEHATAVGERAASAPDAVAVEMIGSAVPAEGSLAAPPDPGERPAASRQEVLRDLPLPGSRASPEFDSVERESVAVEPPAHPPALGAPRSNARSSLPEATSSRRGDREQPMPPPVAPGEQLLPRLSDLPQSERSRLPDLRVSMHVYADSPAGRFILVDGMRRREGEILAPGLELREITRSGAVFALDDLLFQVPRP